MGVNQKFYPVGANQKFYPVGANQKFYPVGANQKFYPVGANQPEAIRDIFNSHPQKRPPKEPQELLLKKQPNP